MLPLLRFLVLAILALGVAWGNVPCPCCVTPNCLTGSTTLGACGLFDRQLHSHNLVAKPVDNNIPVMELLYYALPMSQSSCTITCAKIVNLSLLQQITTAIWTCSDEDVGIMVGAPMNATLNIQFLVFGQCS